MMKTENKPELSIIVPVYNVDEYIRDCLNSIKNQTFKNWECILIDDGSTDFSSKICDSYARKDDRFKVIHQKNKGVSAARNVGIDMSAAPLISFIDPDDFVSLNYFELLISPFSDNNIDVTVSRISTVQENGTESFLGFGSNYISEFIRKNICPRKMTNNTEVINELCENLFSCVSWGKIYKRSLWGEAKFPIGIDLGEDMMTVPAVIIKASGAGNVPDAVYYYRQREKSLLHGTVTKERYEKDLAASQEMVRQLTEYAPQYKQKFKRLKFQYDFGCYMAYIDSNPNAKQSSILFALKDVSGVETYKDFINLMIGKNQDKEEEKTNDYQENGTRKINPGGVQSES